ncbi:Peroxiredoxin Q, chloroplastic [Hondaea fermentalgiana]|uniref:Peroxiredoxin Q, chloroplastic n=1 Tax=Hondaea fermentalgiana TaxID=2315210 RepID=A0A2R5GD96_9STRA|nr:Peroxiredoxin Q, chloroplastic [Hondaea fermentalgiana]|eukprot:GBG28279.1 Peroxiredoxin Q, chloroplastic [Hondaea fermentalgiana]
MIEGQQDELVSTWRGKPGVATYQPYGTQSVAAWWKETLSKAEFTLVLYVRGVWCPYCAEHVKQFSKLQERIKSAGGQMIGITSDGPKGLEDLIKAWKPAFPFLSDPAHALRGLLQEQYKVKIAVSGGPGETKAFYRRHPFISKYPLGCAQPAIVVVTKSGELLFRWAIDPAVQNLGGATDRPAAADVIGVVEKKRKGGYKEGVVDAKDLGVVGSIGIFSVCVIV